MLVCHCSLATSYHCFMSSCIRGKTLVEIFDTENRNLIGTQIISVGHTVEDSRNFYRRWWLFSREITEENRERARGLRKRKKKEWHWIEKEKQGTVPRRRRSLRDRSALSPQYRLWKSCLFLLLRVAKNTSSTRRFGGP